MPFKLLLILSLYATALSTLSAQAEGISIEIGSTATGYRFLDDGRGCNASPYYRARYPIESKRAGEQGVAYVRVKTNNEGAPVLVELAHSSGYRRLDESAVSWVKEKCWDLKDEFKNLDKEAMIMPVRFTLLEDKAPPNIRMGNY